MQRTITLPANTEYVIDIPGRYFGVLSSTAAFSIDVDSGGTQTMKAGRKFVGGAFKFITLRETQNAPNTIAFIISDDKDFSLDTPVSSEPQPVTIQNVPAVTSQNADTYSEGYEENLPDGEAVEFDGLDGTNKRKSIVVNNEEIPTGDLAADFLKRLDVLGSNGIRGLVVYPGESKIWETGGEVTVENNSGAAIRMSAMETFYDL